MTPDGLWMTRLEVEALAGCSHNGPLTLAIERGEVKLRPGPRTRGMPSLERESAERWAAAWREQRARRATELAARRASLRPPDEEHVWLDTATAALLIGVSESGLRTMAASGRAPVTRVGRRLWWRRDLVEAFAAARVVSLNARKRPSPRG